MSSPDESHPWRNTSHSRYPNVPALRASGYPYYRGRHMHLYNTTTFISNECQTSRARGSHHFHLSDPYPPPSVSVYFEAAAMFKAAVKRACPDLIEVTGDVLHRDFSLKKVCAQFDLSPKTPFAVINTGQAQRALHRRDRFANAGSPHSARALPDADA